MLRVKIGCRVEVFWSEDDCYYPGTITKLRENILTSKKPFFLQYDDGEAEWIDLRDHVFRIIKKEKKEEPVATPDKVDSAEPKRKREKEVDPFAETGKHKRIRKKKIIQDF